MLHPVQQIRYFLARNSQAICFLQDSSFLFPRRHLKVKKSLNPFPNMADIYIYIYIYIQCRINFEAYELIT